VLKGAAPITVRPGSLLPPADLEAERKIVAEKTGMDISDRDLASYLMYPKVFVDFAKAADRYGPVSVLPTPVFFYGLPVGAEISVSLERGKQLVIRTQAIGDTDEDGQVRVFFELNGQPRIIRVPNRSSASATVVRRKAEDGNPTHVAAPMPGVVSTLVVAAGQAVKAGDVLLSIEAMKMETALHAERDGTVAEVLVHAGSQIDAKDLLVVFAA
jgi:pyruvate carboxylase